MKKVKVRRSLGQQIIWLPEGYRFDGAEVRIRRENNETILEPISESSEELRAVNSEITSSDLKLRSKK